MKYQYMPTRLRKLKSEKIQNFGKDLVQWEFLHTDVVGINWYNTLKYIALSSIVEHSHSYSLVLRIYYGVTIAHMYTKRQM